MGLGRLFGPCEGGPRKAVATSVIIPTYNEAAVIGATIATVRARASRRAEIIVADGLSRDGTAQAARDAGATVLAVRGGRAAQLNAAARVARAPALLFLHADTAVPPAFDDEIELALARPRVFAGAFRLGIDSNMRGIRVVERFANLRARYMQRPYGDQGLFLTREKFEQIGGYPDMPFLEDFEIVRRIARKGRIEIAKGKVLTSARRWETLGVVPTTVMNQVIIGAYHLGVPVERLRKWYRGVLVRAAERRLRSSEAVSMTMPLG